MVFLLVCFLGCLWWISDFQGWADAWVLGRMFWSVSRLYGLLLGLFACCFIWLVVDVCV